MSKRGCSAGCTHAKKALRGVGRFIARTRIAHARATLGNLIRASCVVPVSGYRNKQFIFFEQAFRQHSAVEDVTRAYDRLYRVHRRRGLVDLTGVFLVDAYDISAEDVRHACDLYGAFDVAVKMNSHGSVTGAAEMAAASMGA